MSKDEEQARSAEIMYDRASVSYGILISRDIIQKRIDVLSKREPLDHTEINLLHDVWMDLLKLRETYIVLT